MKFDISIKDDNFNKAFNLILELEGGYSNDPHDLGGETNLGITNAVYEDYRRNKNYPLQPVRYICTEEAFDIYYHKYWLKSGCDKMPQRIAIAVFDWQVNSGRGVSLLQEILGVTQDGIFGPNTLESLKVHLIPPTGENDILADYLKKRRETYERWAVGKQAEFRAGWLNRIDKLVSYLQVPGDVA